jgi:NADH-quinone oxidoreductase subunit J
MVFRDPGSGTMLRSASVQPRDFGHFLFNRYWLAIEIVSVLLLVALVPILQFGKPSLHPSPPRGEGKGEAEQEGHA